MARRAVREIQVWERRDDGPAGRYTSKADQPEEEFDDASGFYPAAPVDYGREPAGHGRTAG